jgi:hypothetical protein
VTFFFLPPAALSAFSAFCCSFFCRDVSAGVQHEAAQRALAKARTMDQILSILFFAAAAPASPSQGGEENEIRLCSTLVDFGPRQDEDAEQYPPQESIEEEPADKILGKSKFGLR